MTEKMPDSRTKQGAMALAERLLDKLTACLCRNRAKHPLTLELMQKDLVYVIKNYPATTRYFGKHHD